MPPLNATMTRGLVPVSETIGETMSGAAWATLHPYWLHLETQCRSEKLHDHHDDDERRETDEELLAAAAAPRDMPEDDRNDEDLRERQKDAEQRRGRQQQEGVCPTRPRDDRVSHEHRKS